MNVRGLVRRRPAADRVAPGRLRLSRGIDRLLESSRPGYVRGPFAPRPVVRAARPALVVVSAMLGDPERPLSAAALADVERFLTDGARSPLFGHDGDQARAAAESLVERLTDAAPENE